MPASAKVFRDRSLTKYHTTNRTGGPWPPYCGDAKHDCNGRRLERSTMNSYTKSCLELANKYMQLAKMNEQLKTYYKSEGLKFAALAFQFLRDPQ